ncbi:uncharacterized protein LOC111372751 isoform X2 [Olea europaea subsp. europaea]|uniref:Endoplasmic reticulum transmembrane protein n=1 Tax=Olea europaea subsp. europaea TaxID=158383 RepID=A0A8S0QZ62_OLEEU|nr:uncharacterized protein LOC111372751 isoform X2 [Olea europaea subsp. europaea]
MALQWVILTYVVAAEAAVAILLTLPSPKALKSSIVSLISLILQPLLFIIPFATFQLLDIYWKNEHRLMCTGEICTAAERDRYEKSVTILVIILYFCILYFLGLVSLVFVNDKIESNLNVGEKFIVNYWNTSLPCM